MSDTEYVVIGDNLGIEFEVPVGYDLDGANFYCSIQDCDRQAAAIAATSVAIDGVERKCKGLFTPSKTNLFKSDTLYDFDGRLKLANGQVFTLGRGRFKAVSAVTTVV